MSQILNRLFHKCATFRSVWGLSSVFTYIAFMCRTYERSEVACSVRLKLYIRMPIQKEWTRGLFISKFIFMCTLYIHCKCMSVLRGEVKRFARNPKYTKCQLQKWEKENEKMERYLSLPTETTDILKGKYRRRVS